MADTGTASRIIQAFLAGQQIKRQREQDAKEDEERKLRVDDLRNQQARIKHEQKITDFMRKYQFQTGRPAERLPGGDFGTLPSNIPGGVPIPGRIESTPLPNQPMAVPEELGGGLATPQTQEQMDLRTILMEQAKQAAQRQPKGYASSPLGIYSQETGEVTTPAPAPKDNSVTALDVWLQQNPGRKVEDFLKIEKPGAPDRSVTPFEAWREQNPGKPVEDYLKAQNAARATSQSLPAWAKKDLSTLDATDKLLSGIGEKAKLNPGWIRGGITPIGRISGRVSEKRGTLAKDEQLFRKEVKGNLVEQIHQLSGAAVSPTEAERLIQALPDFDAMSPEEFVQAVTASRTAIRMKKEAIEAQFSAGSAPTSPTNWVEQPDGTFAPE